MSSEGLPLDLRYAPYSKWLGPVFCRLGVAATPPPATVWAIDQVVDSTDVLSHAERARRLASLYG